MGAHASCATDLLAPRASLKVYNHSVIRDVSKNEFYVRQLASSFHFVARLRRGRVSISAFLQDVEWGERSSLSGEVLYDEMIENFGLSRIQSIRGQWIHGTNFDQFMALRKSGLSNEEAAKATWSGRMAARHGFTKVINLTIEDCNSRSGQCVELDFVRP